MVSQLALRSVKRVRICAYLVIRQEHLNLYCKFGRHILLGTIFLLFVIRGGVLCAQPATGGATNEIRIVELQGTVEVSPAGAKTWVLTQTNQVLHPQDRLRT